MKITTDKNKLDFVELGSLPENIVCIVKEGTGFDVSKDWILLTLGNYFYFSGTHDLLDKERNDVFVLNLENSKIFRVRKNTLVKVVKSAEVVITE